MTLKRLKAAVASILRNKASFVIIDLVFEEKFRICCETSGRRTEVSVGQKDPISLQTRDQS